MPEPILDVPRSDLPENARLLLDPARPLPAGVVHLREDVSVPGGLAIWLGAPMVLLLAAGLVKHVIDLLRLRKNVVLESIGAVVMLVLVVGGAWLVADVWRTRQAAATPSWRHGVLLTSDALLLHPWKGGASWIPRERVAGARTRTTQEVRLRVQRLVVDVEGLGAKDVAIPLEVSPQEAAQRIEAWRTAR